jgi:hypothetical protein
MSASPAELLAEAERLLTRRSADLRGTWPRAVALLTRQALEQTLDDLWRWKAPGTQLASRRAQLLCLGAFVGGEELTRDVRYAWAELSRACHHHPYDLPARADELTTCWHVVAALLSALKTLPH